MQGDAGIDTILDVYEQALQRHPRDDHRLRLEHVGAIRNDQLQRAAELGVTCSIFVDQIHYWATSSSTGCLVRNADPVGCQQVPRLPPACGSPCTTIRRSHPRSRCATSAWASPGSRPAAGCWHPRSG
ncbi:amidohydrolase family protein [Mycobacterium xenopi 4042]|uniref:Amidohydrolase family protein n=1 Tax=Mycobacterium xenopi 4042 TaxID=1299334 RepID=X8C7Q6_MYCXE|nr:amidohydrolase family protein [Mycobacterium xenopi 4042]